MLKYGGRPRASKVFEAEICRDAVGSVASETFVAVVEPGAMFITLLYWSKTLGVFITQAKIRSIADTIAPETGGIFKIKEQERHHDEITDKGLKVGAQSYSIWERKSLFFRYFVIV